MRAVIRYHKICLNCKEPFLTTEKDQKFNNVKCSQEYRIKQMSLLSKEEKSKIFGKRLKRKTPTSYIEIERENLDKVNRAYTKAFDKQNKNKKHGKNN